MLTPTLDDELHSSYAGSAYGSPSSGPKCEKHGERITGLCLHDMQPVCSVCKDYDHERHNRVDCVDAIAHLQRSIRVSASPSNIRTRIDDQQQRVNVLRLQLAEEEQKLQQLRLSEITLDSTRSRLDSLDTQPQDLPAKMMTLLKEFKSMPHHLQTPHDALSLSYAAIHSPSHSTHTHSPSHSVTSVTSSLSPSHTKPTFTWKMSPACDSVTLSSHSATATNVGFTLNYRNVVYANWELSQTDEEWEIVCKSDKEKESWIGIGVIPVSALNKAETANHFHMFGISSFGQLWRSGQHTPDPSVKFHEGRLRFVYTARDNMLEIHVNTTVKHFVIPGDMLPVCPCAVIGSPHSSVSVLRDSLSSSVIHSIGHSRGG